MECINVSIFSEATRQYERKVGADSTDKSNKTSIMAQIENLRPQLEEHYAVVMVHKAKPHPKKPSHRSVHFLPKPQYKYIGTAKHVCTLHIHSLWHSLNSFYLCVMDDL